MDPSGEFLIVDGLARTSRPTAAQDAVDSLVNPTTAAVRMLLSGIIDLVLDGLLGPSVDEPTSHAESAHNSTDERANTSNDEHSEPLAMSDDPWSVAASTVAADEWVLINDD